MCPRSIFSFPDTPWKVAWVCGERVYLHHAFAMYVYQFSTSRKNLWLQFVDLGMAFFFFLIDRLWDFELVLSYGSSPVVGMSIDVVAS
jgi:hypothetical protein